MTVACCANNMRSVKFNTHIPVKLGDSLGISIRYRISLIKSLCVCAHSLDPYLSKLTLRPNHWQAFIDRLPRIQSIFASLKAFTTVEMENVQHLGEDKHFARISM